MNAIDPFYFQTDNAISFLIPDKAQHFWGSYALARLVGKPIALAAGIAWESWQKSRGDIFSKRDLLADALGVLAARKRGPPRFACLWNTERKEITIQFTLNF